MRALQRHHGLSAAAAGPRGVRPRRQAEGCRSGCAGNGRGKDRAAERALAFVYGRIDAGDRRRLRRAGRGAAGNRPRAWARLHRSAVAAARARGDNDPGVRSAQADDPRVGARCRDHRPAALFEADLCGRQEDQPPAQAFRDRRVQRRRGLRRRRDAAAAARRRGGGDGRAVPPHSQRAGRDVSGGRGRLSRRDRCDRHGPQHGRRARRLCRAAQVRWAPYPAADRRRDGADRRPRRAAPARWHVRWRDRRGAGRVPARRGVRDRGASLPPDRQPLLAQRRA